MLTFDPIEPHDFCEHCSRTFSEILGTVSHSESEQERIDKEIDLDAHDIDKCNSLVVGFKTALVEVIGCANSMPAPTPIASSDVAVSPASPVANTATPVRTIDGSPSSTERQYLDPEVSSGSEIRRDCEPSADADLGVPLHTLVEASHSDGPDDVGDNDGAVAIDYPADL